MDRNLIHSQTDGSYELFMDRIMPQRNRGSDSPSPIPPTRKPKTKGPGRKITKRFNLVQRGSEIIDTISNRVVSVISPNEMKTLLDSFTIEPPHGGRLRQRFLILYQRQDLEFIQMELQLGVKHPYSSVDVLPQIATVIQKFIHFTSPEEAANRIITTLDSAGTPAQVGYTPQNGEEYNVTSYNNALANEITREIKPILNLISERVTNPTIADRYCKIVRAVALRRAYRTINVFRIQAVYAPGNRLIFNQEATEPECKRWIEQIQENTIPEENGEGDINLNAVLNSTLDERMKKQNTQNPKSFLEDILAQNLEQAITTRQPVLEEYEKEYAGEGSLPKTPENNTEEKQNTPEPVQKFVGITKANLPSVAQTINGQLFNLQGCIDDMKALAFGSGTHSLSTNTIDPLLKKTEKLLNDLGETLSITGTL